LEIKTIREVHLEDDHEPRLPAIGRVRHQAFRSAFQWWIIGFLDIIMHPITHLLVGWTIANMARLDKRDRMLVTVAGVMPDLDGIGVVADILTEHTRSPLDLYGTFHHVLAHNLGACIAVTTVAALLANRKVLTTFLVALSFHLHLLGDILGSRGPDGYQWPIPYLLPFSNAWNLTWSHQWGLKAWPNVTVSIILLALAFYWAWKRGRSPVEMISSKADLAVVRTLRARFGEPAENLPRALLPK
jgi:inner membrane protein